MEMDTTPQAVTWFKRNQRYLLTKAITAFAFSSYGSDEHSYGAVCELPRGASLEVCGPGFSERTLMARCGDSYYHVFYRDLSSATDMKNQPVDLENLRQFHI